MPCHRFSRILSVGLAVCLAAGFGASAVSAASADSALVARRSPWRPDARIFLGFGHITYDQFTATPKPLVHDQVSDIYGSSFGGQLAWHPAFFGLEAGLALGGILYKPTNRRDFQSRQLQYALVPKEFWLRFPFQAGSWTAALQGGGFLWGFNPDALLAGEYLARRGNYPMQHLRGVHAEDPLDSLKASMTGFRAALVSPGRRLAQEVLVVRDEQFAEAEWSLIYAATLAPRPGLELGGAWEWLGFTASDRMHRIYYGDETWDTLEVWNSTLLSARFAVEPATLLGLAPRRDRGGRVYFETALMGLDSRGRIYPDLSRRIHLLAGIHLPAAGLLDDFRLQAERVSFNPVSGYEEGVWYPGNLVPETRDTHVWVGQVLLSRTVKFLTLQAWLAAKLGEESGGIRYPRENSNYIERTYRLGLRGTTRF